MSRIAKRGLDLPNGIQVTMNEQIMTVKGTKGTLTLDVHDSVEVVIDGSHLSFRPQNGQDEGWAHAGTACALANNMIKGVSQGFEKKLQLVGVGYRAQAQGDKLTLSLGFSHPVVHAMPAGITVETPSQTEIIIRGVDKQKVGQVAAEVRAYRPPEPYKGKGVKYADEQVLRKEAKKK
ncbi:MAG: 50S ribosomal protein L6 [Thiofilum sp.]|uniref:50S ribosomal protein L6 n=1 Tax=Thiofilum sp. TaxID=2212733 RepID=UPI0025DA87B8|nr:50S ribosomal protein L6 [Thiofilum sp.]MBK8452048.1 50S ribosomal protein L6 [Thiofilum sp.]